MCLYALNLLHLMQRSKWRCSNGSVVFVVQSDEPELEPELEEEEVFSRPTMTMDYWPQ